MVANTVSLRTTTRIYQARFNSADWSGSVVSFPVDPVTGALKPVEWDVADILKTQDYNTGREIITWDQTANSGAGAGVPFRWASLNVAQQLALNTNPVTLANDGLGSSRVDYLRGDASKELKNSGTFRSRSTPLGDVVNSTPTVVGAPLFGYPDSMETVPYSTFAAAYDDVECYLPNVAQIPANLRPVGDLEREPILYFGGNDGALHGVSACSGEERIAYVPKSVYSQLGTLTSQDYQHRYFVDGPSTVVDAYWGGAWHTVLVGTLRGGGKGVFALDVTDPSKFDETYASQLALWDIEATPATAGSDFEELGYTYSQPSVVKVDGLGWVALFGNGYHGKSGKAILYVVRINDGTLLQTIDLSATGPGSGSHGTGNGLSTVAPVDTDGDGDADLVYGGDLNGNGSVTNRDIWPFVDMVQTGGQFDACAMWEDMCYNQGPMISPVHARRFLLPHYRRINELCVRHGVEAILLDSDGRIDELIRFIREDQAEQGETPTLRRVARVGGFNTKDLFQLFPKKPARKMSYVSGLPKPAGCI